jgi:hypothetical protein
MSYEITANTGRCEALTVSDISDDAGVLHG